MQLNFKKISISFFVIILFHPALAFADETTGSIEITIKNQRGDRLDPSSLSLKVFQSQFNDPLIEIESVPDNPYLLESLLVGKKYKIKVYYNSMFAATYLVDLENEHEKHDITIQDTGGIRFTVFYDDGYTPIKNAKLSVKSHDGKEWANTITDSDGRSMRHWLQPNIQDGDYYEVDVLLDENISYKHSPIAIWAGQFQETKIITPWPEIVEQITISLYEEPLKKVTKYDEGFEVELFNSDGGKVAKSQILWGDALLTLLKVGNYVVKITKYDSSNILSEWASQNITVTGQERVFSILKSESVLEGPDTSNLSNKTIQNPVDTATDIKTTTLTCNCVAFRLDDIQDYWLNDVQVKLIETFREEKIPLTIGVVANVFGDDPKIVNVVKDSLNADFEVEIANHGIGNEPFTNFDKTRQEKMVKESQSKIFEILEIKPISFIPPQNRYNEETLSILKENGIMYISSSILHGETPPFPLEGQSLYKFPETATTGNFDQELELFVGVSGDETFNNVLKSIESYGFAVITLHPQEFSEIKNNTYQNQPNEKQFAELEKLILEIQRNNLEIVVLSQINLDSELPAIPHWIRNNAEWWSKGLIKEGDFLYGIQYMIKENIMVIPDLPEAVEGGGGQVPVWIKNNAGWWAQGLIDDSSFVSGIQWLITNGILQVEIKENQIQKTPQDVTFSPFVTIEDPDKMVLIWESFSGTLSGQRKTIFDIYGMEGDYVEVIQDNKRVQTWKHLYISLDPDNMALYNEIAIWNDPQNTVVVFPEFTSTAYHEPGFYAYYRGECDWCTTVEMKPVEILDHSSGNAIQIFTLLGYPYILDSDIDKNPSILEKYDKVIMLHSEYVTRGMFDAITSHPNVIFLYPNALYAEIEVNYIDNTQTLIKGHGYPDPEITNGFGWEFENTHPYEYDYGCADMEFYKIDNGWMTNCYPEWAITDHLVLLKAIKDL